MPSDEPSRAPFRTTRWSLVARAGRDDPAGRRALEELCALYWPPVYALFRREGLDVHDARDLTQGLFLDLLERGDLLRTDPARGRFRSFLRACARHYLANERDRTAAQKRGGARPRLSLDTSAEETVLGEPIDHRRPDTIFERRWAQAVLEEALRKIEEEETSKGRGRMFHVVRPTLSGEGLGRPYADVAEDMGTSEGALKVVVHRLRRRFRELLVAEVRHTLVDPEEAIDEIGELLAAFEA